MSSWITRFSIKLSVTITSSSSAASTSATSWSITSFSLWSTIGVFTVLCSWWTTWSITSSSASSIIVLLFNCSWSGSRSGWSSLFLLHLWFWSIFSFNSLLVEVIDQFKGINILDLLIFRIRRNTKPVGDVDGVFFLDPRHVDISAAYRRKWLLDNRNRTQKWDESPC